MEVGCLVFNFLPDFFFLSFSLFLVYFTGGLFLFESETEAFDTGGTKLFFFFFWLVVVSFTPVIPCAHVT